jgi:hypothetical protein
MTWLKHLRCINALKIYTGCRRNLYLEVETTADTFWFWKHMLARQRRLGICTL